jgi:hypothetical protein
MPVAGRRAYVVAAIPTRRGQVALHAQPDKLLVDGAPPKAQLSSFPSLPSERRANAAVRREKQ